MIVRTPKSCYSCEMGEFVLGALICSVDVKDVRCIHPNYKFSSDVVGPGQQIFDKLLFTLVLCAIRGYLAPVWLLTYYNSSKFENIIILFRCKIAHEGSLP